MEKRTLRIEINGSTGAGKTHLVMIISEALLQLGFNVETVDADIIDGGAVWGVRRLRNYLSSGVPQNTLVVVKTVQQPKTTQSKEA